MEVHVLRTNKQFFYELIHYKRNVYIPDVGVDIISNVSLLI